MRKIYGIGDEEELSEDLQKELPNRIIAELEKIKSEFLFKCKENLRFDNDIVLECFTDLVDKKISELKGENNE